MNKMQIKVLSDSWDGVFKIIVLVMAITAGILVAGYFDSNVRLPADYEKAVYFCGGKNNIAEYDTGFMQRSSVICKNGSGLDETSVVILPTDQR